MDFYFPKVSIITVVRNAESSIEGTIASIISQNYPNIEYIVLDGQSQDRTNSIIQNYSDNIDIYISESDKGIFDAMNKGAELASGDWIIYMNAGDRFYANDSLTKISDALNSDADAILAGVEKILVDRLETRHFYTMPGAIEDIWRQIPTTHQAILVRLSCQQQYQFDTSYVWCADHDLLARMYRDGKKFLRQEHIICYFDCSGGKNRDLKLFIRERWQLSRGLVPWYRRWLHYGGELFHCTVWGKFVSVVKMFLPKSTILKLRRWRGTAGS
jgi:glycosyltransferase involved in cell wall biosynthesis